MASHETMILTDRGMRRLGPSKRWEWLHSSQVWASRPRAPTVNLL